MRARCLTICLQRATEIGMLIAACTSEQDGFSTWAVLQTSRRNYPGSCSQRAPKSPKSHWREKRQFTTRCLWRVGSGAQSGMAHNSKVVGSNPTPATNEVARLQSSISRPGPPNVTQNVTRPRPTSPQRCPGRPRSRSRTAGRRSRSCRPSASWRPSEALRPAPCSDGRAPQVINGNRTAALGSIDERATGCGAWRRYLTRQLRSKRNSTDAFSDVILRRSSSGTPLKIRSRNSRDFGHVDSACGKSLPQSMLSTPMTSRSRRP